MNGDRSSVREPTSNSAYRPALWERIIGYVSALFIIALVAFVIIRDKPLQDPNFALFLRILLSGAMAIIGAVVPGFLSVDLSGRGVAIRAGGALALFVVTFFFSPRVLPQISRSVQYPWARRMAQLNGDFERLTTPLPPGLSDDEYTLIKRAQSLEELQGRHSNAFEFLNSQKLSDLPTPKQLIRFRYYEAMAHYQVAALAAMRSENTPNIARDRLIQLVKEATEEASKCVDAANEGFRWCQNVLTYPADRERTFADAPRKWSPDEYREVQEWVQEGIDEDLIWYRTAGRATLAYYGQYDSAQAQAEIEELMNTYPPWSKDPPQKDGIMRRILNGESARGVIVTTSVDDRVATSVLTEVNRDHNQIGAASSTMGGYLNDIQARAGISPRSQHGSRRLLHDLKGPCCR